MPYDPATYDPDSDGPIISWKYAGRGHELDAVEGIFRFVTATNMDEFGEGIEYIPSSRHVKYADRDGNIAYWMSGREPVRPPGEWRFPQGLLGPPMEWDSETLVERCTDRNTSQGFYAGWNTKCSSDYVASKPPEVSFGPFDPAHVIFEYLSTHDNLTFEDVRDLALNIGTTFSFAHAGNPWAFVETHFSAVVNANSTPERAAALDLMASWDGHYVDGGEPAWPWGMDRADAWVLMNTWIKRVLYLTFDDELGSLGGQPRKRLFDVLLHGLPGTTMNNRYNWFQNLTNGNEPQTADEIILVALDGVLAGLGPRPWGTGTRGRLKYAHPSLRIGVVHTIPYSSRSTYSQCVEYGSTGPVRIESMFPLGQSGTIYKGPGLFLTPVFDPHFFSMTDVFDGFAHRAFPLFD
jgi:penicillin amidase